MLRPGAWDWDPPCPRPGAVRGRTACARLGKRPAGSNKLSAVIAAFQTERWKEQLGPSPAPEAREQPASSVASPCSRKQGSPGPRQPEGRFEMGLEGPRLLLGLRAGGVAASGPCPSPFEPLRGLHPTNTARAGAGEQGPGSS